MIILLYRLIWEIRKMEVKNRLLNYKDMYIYQDDSFFSFSIDSVLLADFVNINLRDKKIIDLCTGNGVIPLFLSYKTKERIIGVELQKEVYDLAIKSINVNNLSDRIDIINYDVRNIKKLYNSDSFDIVTCNPPYFETKNVNMQNDNMVKNIARHEVMINLEDVIENASYLLKNGKKFVMVHRPNRLIEIITLFKKYKLEPKRIKFCYPKKGESANILLIEGVKNGNKGLVIEDNLYVHNDDNSYTDIVRKMFGE